MERDFLIELTGKLYRLTLLFPKKDPLRYKMREAGVDVMKSWIIWEGLLSKGSEKKVGESIFEIEQNLDVLNDFFEVAKWQNWANFFEVLELQKEYAKLKEKIKDKEKEMIFQNEAKELAKSAEKESVESGIGLVDEKIETDKGLDDRKKKIIDFLGERGRAQVWELNKVLPDVTKRTLRRDFQYLYKKGLIERVGEKNNTFYQMKKEELSGADSFSGSYTF